MSELRELYKKLASIVTTNVARERIKPGDRVRLDLSLRWPGAEVEVLAVQDSVGPIGVPETVDVMAPDGRLVRYRVEDVTPLSNTVATGDER